MSDTKTPRTDEDECGFIPVKESAIDWLKKHYPALCEKSGLCEMVGGILYTKTRPRSQLERELESSLERVSELERQRDNMALQIAAQKRAHADALEEIAKLRGDAKPVCYFLHKDGKPEWSECCVGISPDDLPLDCYDEDEHYTAVPLYYRADYPEGT